MNHLDFTLKEFSPTLLESFTRAISRAKPIGTGHYWEMELLFEVVRQSYDEELYDFVKCKTPKLVRNS